jgi:hypothetical protein
VEGFEEADAMLNFVTPYLISKYPAMTNVLTLFRKNPLILFPFFEKSKFQVEQNQVVFLSFLRTLLLHWYSTDQYEPVMMFYRKYRDYFLVRKPSKIAESVFFSGGFSSGSTNLSYYSVSYPERIREKLHHLQIGLQYSKYANVILYALFASYDLKSFEEYLRCCGENKLKYFGRFREIYQTHKDSIHMAITARVPSDEVLLKSLDDPGGPLGYIPTTSTRHLVSRLDAAGIKTAGDFREFLLLSEAVVKQRLPGIDMYELRALMAVLVTRPILPKLPKPSVMFDTMVPIQF